MRLERHEFQSKFQLQSVMGQDHAGRKLLLCDAMIETVRQVRQQRPARLERLDHREGVAQRKVRRMLFIPQRIQNQDVQALQERPALFGNSAHIGAISHPADAKTQDR